MLFRKGNRFGPSAEQLMIDCEHMMFIEVLRYLPVAQTRIQRRETDDQLIS